MRARPADVAVLPLLQGCRQAGAGMRGVCLLSLSSLPAVG